VLELCRVEQLVQVKALSSIHVSVSVSVHVHVHMFTLNLSPHTDPRDAVPLIRILLGFGTLPSGGESAVLLEQRASLRKCALAKQSSNLPSVCVRTAF
jgi:hypothetical protein